MVAMEGGKLKPFMSFDPEFFSPDPRIRMILWSRLIGRFVAFLSRYGADQTVIQHYFSARNLRLTQHGLWLNATVAVISLSLLVLFGLAVYAYAAGSGMLAHKWEQYRRYKHVLLIKVDTTLFSNGVILFFQIPSQQHTGSQHYRYCCA